MANNGNHIISRFRWNTSFDEKSKGGEMQERLSNWSRFSMPGEITTVFDDVCPPEQTWRIQTLKIDLGLIDYSNMEFELATKLRRQLSEKLFDMIFYANRSGNNMEILNEETSHLYLISSFLLSGLMPWSYKTTDGTLNQMLASQLQHNREKSIDMIREVGVTHENVRKRIAWQVNEPNIIKIIEGLEPNNHTQIIDFSNELVKLQVKENIVQTSTKDLKKQLWLWILNYLLTERGTVFNKVAYMKSTIGQMADHYNISYYELLDLIDHAVQIVGKKYGIKSDFLLTLNILTKEYKDHQQNIVYQQVEATNDLWELLQTYFTDSNKQLLKSQKAEFNELVTGLYNENHAKFKELVLSLGNNKSLWVKAVSYLNDASLEATFTALASSAATGIVHVIYFFSTSGRQLNKRWDRGTLWNMGLQYLYGHQGGLASDTHFLNYCIAALGEHAHVPKQQLIGELIGARITAKDKTPANLIIANNLASLYIDEIAGTSSTVISSQSIVELLDALVVHTHQGFADKKLFISQQKRLERHLQFSPKAVLQTLIRYRNKSDIQLLIPYILNNYTTSVLLKEAQSISPFFDLLYLIKKEANLFFKQGEAISNTISATLMPLALNTFILHPDISVARLLGVLFNEFYTLITDAQVIQFQQLIVSMVKAKKLPLFFMAHAESQVHAKTINNTVTGSILQAISSASHNKAAVGKLLMANFTNTEIVQLRATRSKERSVILNYLMPRGELLMEALIKRYINLLRHEIPGTAESKLRLNLIELFWKTIAAYNEHRGNWESLKKTFHKAVVVKFSVSLTNQIRPFKPALDNHLPQGKQLMDLLVKQYSAILITELSCVSETQVVAQLIELYKACIADVQAHGGSSSKIISMFKRLVISTYSIQNTCLFNSVVIDRLKTSSKIIASDPQSINLLHQHEITAISDKIHRLRNGNEVSLSEIIALVKDFLYTENKLIKIDNEKISFKELVNLLLESDACLLREIIAQTPVSQKRIQLLQSAISFNKFSLWIAIDADASLAKAMESLRVLYDLVRLLNAGTVAGNITNLFWQQTWQLLSTNIWSIAKLNDLVETSFRQLITQTPLNAQQLLAVIVRHNLRLTPVLKQALINYFPALTFTGQSNNYPDQPLPQLAVAAQQGLLAELCYSLMAQKQLPVWFSNTRESVNMVMNEIIIHYPVQVLAIIKQHVIPEQQLDWLSKTVDFNLLISAIGHLNKTRQPVLTIIGQFYYALGRTSIRGITAPELQFILFKKVIKAWSADNWRLLSAEYIWNELLWEVCTKRGLSKTDFIKDSEKTIAYFPPALQISFGYLKEQYRKPTLTADTMPLIKPAKKVLQSNNQASLKGGIAVKNAGMVLVSSYIPMLFERLGLTNNKKFVNIDAQRKAVHYLQYVVTGLTQTDESFLPLNKMMCGLELSQPVTDGIDITEEQVKLINGLIRAVIDYWPAIGNTSVDGFRGNWLVRDGLLTEQEDRWELMVEKRAYDILIHRSPFSFSIIKHPWMDKPLHVTWPY